MGQMSVRVSGAWRTVSAVWVRNSGAWHSVKTVWGRVSGAWRVIKDFGPPINKSLTLTAFSGSATDSPSGSGMYRVQTSITFGSTSGPLWGDGEFVGLDLYKDDGAGFYLYATQTYQSPDTSPKSWNTAYDWDSSLLQTAYIDIYWTNSSGLRSFETVSGTITPGP